MKCKWCGEEWTAVNSRVRFACPYCRKQIISLDKPVLDLETGLSYLVDNYGTTVYDDKQTVLEFIDTFFPEKKRERNFINIAYSVGSVKIILSAKSVSNHRKQSMLENAINQMIEEYGIDEEWATFIVGAISRSLGISLTMDDSVISLRNRAESGEAESQNKLALYYYSQDKFSDYEFWIKKAIESDSQEAKYHYGVYLVSEKSPTVNIDEGVALLVQLAKENDVDAVCYLGKHHDIVRDQEFNIEQHISTIVAIPERLRCSHWLDLSCYYEDTKQFEQAINAAEKAYMLDKLTAWERYVDLLESRNERFDDFTAGKVLREIAENGNIHGVYRLAEKLDKKAKSASDMMTVLYWYKIAAEGGKREARYRLAEIFEQGYLTDKDIEKAIYWYEASVVSGSKEAFEKLRYKSKNCIQKSIVLATEDDNIECPVKGVINVGGQDYLIIADPDTADLLALIYTEDMEHLDYNIDMVDEADEEAILQHFRRMHS